MQYEDQLPLTMTDAEYDAWFAQSWVKDGVRVGPQFKSGVNMKEEFGDLLRSLLKKHNISQRQLAKWTEISRETINRFLAGTYKPGQSSVEAIAFCYGFSEDERIALFRTARCLPTALIEKFLNDEQFALECWRRTHESLQVAMHMRTPRVYS